MRIPKPLRNLALSIGMALVLVIGASIIPWSAEQPQAAVSAPVSIEELRRYIDDWSEPEGYFDSDNFISNETSYLHVIDDLHSRVRPGRHLPRRWSRPEFFLHRSYTAHACDHYRHSKTKHARASAVQSSLRHVFQSGRST